MLIKVLKLVSGEEVVAEIVHHDESEIVIKNPLAIILQRGQQQGEIGIGFVPFAPYAGRSATINIRKDKIVFEFEVDDEMRNQYNTIFGGIVTPPKTLIVG
jgi:hypothetical protein